MLLLLLLAAVADFQANCCLFCFFVYLNWSLGSDTYGWACIMISLRIAISVWTDTALVKEIVRVPFDPHSKNSNMGAVSLLLLRNSMFTFHNYTKQMKQKIACKCLIVHSTMLWDSLHLHYLYNVQLWRAQTFKILWVYFMLCTICFTFYLGYCCHRNWQQTCQI